MKGLRFLTAGESHGKGLIGIIEGVPAGLPLSPEDIDRDLARRQLGYGRGGRMKIEKDRASIISGVRWGQTMGSPISLLIENRDWKNWQEGMSSESDHAGSIPPVTRPRPGHADLAGALKYNQRDVRNILERSSARETAMRVAVGAVAKRLLSEFGISVASAVTRIGGVKSELALSLLSEEELAGIGKRTDESPVRCLDKEASQEMVLAIDEAVKRGDTLGGVFEVVVTGLPSGLGSHIQWDTRLEGRLCQAMMGIQAIKGVEIGAGFRMAESFGSDVLDEIYYDSQSGFYRKTNHAGGIEGGMTNGMPVVIRAAMKPIPTLRKPLSSVDIVTKEPFEAAYERSDACAVPAAAVVGEAMAALVIADAFLEKFSGDSVEETRRNLESYREYLRNF